MPNTVGNPQVLQPSTPATAPVGSLFLDATNGNTPSFKDKSGVIQTISGLMAHSDPQAGLGAETNTLIEPDVSFPEWRGGVSGGLTISRLTAQETLDSLLDGVWVNAQKDVGSDIPLNHLFTAPAGATSLPLIVPMKMPTGVASNTVALEFWDYTLNAIVPGSKVTFTLTNSALSRAAITLSNPVAGRLYGVNIRVNDASQNANPIVGRVTLAVVGGSGTFASDFFRLRVQAAIVAGNIQNGWNTGVYPYISPNADIILNTNSRTIAVESWGSSASGTVAYLYAGQPLTNGSTVPNGGYGIDDIALPFTGRSENVTVRTGTGATAIGFVLGKYGGVFPRAIFLPAGASFFFSAVTTKDLCIGIGDSLILGNDAGSLPFESWAARFRLQYSGNFALDAHNSRTLFDYAGTAAQQSAFAQYLARNRPKHIIWDLMVNDHISHPWPGGAPAGSVAYGVALANVVDLVHQYSPQTIQYLKTACPLSAAQELDKGNGTLAQFRTAMTNIVTTSRAPYCVLVDGTTFYTTADLSADGIHATTVGQAKAGAAMYAAFAARNEA